MSKTAGKTGTAANGIDDIGCARIDFDRSRRCGFPEFIYGAGKNIEQLKQIIARMVSRTGEAMTTRLDEVKGRALQESFPEGELDPVAGTFVIQRHSGRRCGNVAVLCAGTSDLSVAQEALNTLHFCGIGATLYTDVGVACLDRILALKEDLRRADSCIVAAGMEGALPSVVGGLTPAPVIAVPTSVGYGAALGGFAALAGMLNSCSSGITVVNIDNGFGAACAAVRIMRNRENCNKDQSATAASDT